jgi:hypothetical protein
MEILNNLFSRKERVVSLNGTNTKCSNNNLIIYLTTIFTYYDSIIVIIIRHE